ncbi:MAG: glycerate kinase [Armatimonadota bacterium]|nr:glycerate kinase [Armatimonadota bacterium]
MSSGRSPGVSVGNPPFSGKILCAPDSFKGTLTSIEAAEAMVQGVQDVWPDAQVRLLPLADGGEGSLDVLHGAAGGVLHQAVVEGPLGLPVDARWLELPDRVAVVEMAQAAGLLLVPPEERNPESASTYGVGQLIRAAIDNGASAVIICLGGSATTDGGAGMAEALGFRLPDRHGQTIPRGGAGLKDLDHIDDSAVHSGVRSVRFIAATDVTNPLCGLRGAAAIFGPQKGADPAAVARLERGLQQLAGVIAKDRRINVLEIAGGGAAGGLGAGLVGFLNASVQSGAETLMDAAGLDEALRQASLCITGEGRIDSQSASGKLLVQLAMRCKQNGVPLIAIGGTVSADSRALGNDLFQGLLSATKESGPMPATQDEAARRLRETTADACRLIRLGSKLASR